jgi:hypothetical protein
MIALGLVGIAAVLLLGLTLWHRKSLPYYEL